MDESVAKLNIEHFRRLLTEETEVSKRETLCRLLAEEEAKLDAIIRSRTDSEAL